MLRPSTVDEVSEAVRDAKALRIIGEGSQGAWRLPQLGACEVLEMKGLAGVLELHPQDQVVVVRAGTGLLALQEELGLHGLCLPFLEFYDGYSHRNVFHGTVGGALSLNLPHVIEGECGSWRDWVIGMTVVLADGTVAKAGSKAVKNVAGYDVHKLFIGARGTLGVLVEVVLRTYPVASLPKCGGDGHYDPTRVDCSTMWYQRTLPSDFEAACLGSMEFNGSDYPSSTWLLRNVPCDRDLARFAGDAVWRCGCGSKNLQITDPTQIRLMKRAKEIFDPTRKLNPGEMGIF